MPFYHGTGRALVPSILKHGLLTPRMALERGVVSEDQVWPCHMDCVCLTADQTLAEHYGGCTRSVEEAVVLEILIDPNLLEPDPLEPRGYLFWGRIPPDCIRTTNG